MQASAEPTLKRLSAELGVFETARDAFWLRVSDYLAIVGYDGTVRTATPLFDLTTYSQPTQEMAAVFVDMLKKSCERGALTQKGELLMRRTT